MKVNRLAGRALAALLLTASLGLAACGGDDDDAASDNTTTAASAAIVNNPDNANTTITVGSKNFTEQKVLGEIYAQALAAAGYDVKTELNLGDEKTALKAIEGGTIDAYPEYTGTALGSFFNVKSEDIPKDPQQAFDDAKAGFAEKQLTAFDPTPFTSSNEVAVTAATAQKLGLTNISDLEGEDQDLTLYGSPECRQRQDCLLGLEQVYGLKFKKFTPVAIDLRHEVLKKGQADVSIVFTTDPQIKRENEVLLKDDKGMFPPYNSTLVVRDDKVQAAGGDLKTAVDKATKGLTAEVMQELNARVDLDKKTPKAVAAEYLNESGLTS
jgi:osmoprotectant transport system substrate-binding protein